MSAKRLSCAFANDSFLFKSSALMIRNLFLMVCLVATCSQGIAQEVTTKVFASNLKNPWGVAIRPVIGEIFVSDTGRGRIIHVTRDSINEIVSEFPMEEFELDRGLILGPMALGFRGRNRLIVGTGGGQDGEDSISVYDIENVENGTLKAKDFEYQKILDADGDQPAEGNFFNMVRSKYSLFVSCNGDKKKGWIASSQLLVNDMGDLKRLIPTNEKAGVPSPGGICISPEKHLVIAQMGTRDTPGDSILTFYSEGGELLDKFPTGLSDIVAMAYGPRKKRLYALDFNWAEPKKGGLYKLVAVDSQEGCTAELVTYLDRPTAMAFDKNGNLYVTVCGFDDEESDVDEEYSAPGKCLLIRGVD